MVLREMFAKLGLQVDPTGFTRAEAMLGSVKTTLVGLGVTLTAGAVYHGLKQLVDNTANAAFEASKNAKMIGISREAYDELGFAARESGVHVETLQTGLRYLNVAAARAAQGGREFSRAFRTLGVSPAGKPVDKLLMDIAAAYERLPKSDPRRVLFARELFGRGGIDMLRLLDKGKAGLAEMREEAHKLGLVFSDEDVEAATNFRQASLALHSTLESLKRAIAIPLMRELAKGKRELTEWLKANRELIRERVIGFVKLLMQTLQALLSVLHGASEALIAVAKGIAAVAKESGVLKGVFIALGLAGAMALAPMLTMIGALLLVLEDVWGWVTGKRKKTVMGRMFGSFDEFKKSGLGGLAHDMADAFHEAYDWLVKIADKLGVGAKKDESSGFLAAVRRMTGFSEETAGKAAKNVPMWQGATEFQKLSPAMQQWLEMNAEEEARRKGIGGWGLEHYNFVNRRKWELAREWSAPSVSAPPMIAAPGSSTSLSVGTLILQGASTDKPKDFAYDFMEQLNIQLGIANAAVAK